MRAPYITRFGYQTLADELDFLLRVRRPELTRAVSEAAAQHCDAYISGEVSEKTFHEAAELGVHYFACGHHATERGGVMRLGQAIAKQFGILVEFIDIPSPV